MNASSLRDSVSMRVLSPRMEPPDSAEEGSTARTATRCPASMSRLPRLSINVDLPTPGTPEIPRRIEPPEKGVRSSSRRLAGSRSSGWLDSTSVIARPSARRSPDRSSLASSSGDGLPGEGATASAKLDDWLVNNEALALFREDLCDRHIAHRAEAVFHFHGLNHGDFLAGLQFLADAHGEAYEQARHG